MSTEMLFWVDIETTGLDVVNEHVLEIAAFLAPLEDPFTLTPVLNKVLMWPKSANIADLDPVVRKMHTENGLLYDSLRSVVEEEAVELELMKALPTDVIYYPAGSSVHFDMAFLDYHFFNLKGRFSHRHFDVTSMKLLAKSQGMPPLPKGGAHRARADVLESVEHAKACLAWLRGR